MDPKPVIAVTLGDPAGIGPELCLRMMTDPAVLAVARPVLFGNAALLRRVAGTVGLPCPGIGPTLVDIACDTPDSIVPGRVSAVCGATAYRCIEAAVLEALAGRVAAVVTAPLNKESLNRAGHAFPGHTEILAMLTGTPRPCMMLASEAITVSLVTTHTSLTSVPGKLTTDRILGIVRLTDAAMRRLCGEPPRLVVCALNPHAGEHGLFGDEERRIIEPAVAQARSEGYAVEGPLPPDTAFLPSRLGRTVAHICMYHDQGLIPFKMLAFDNGVNITLGLPIVRTSPDHGTAFDIAWTGKADPGSMRQAILTAARLIPSPQPSPTRGECNDRGHQHRSSP